MPNATVGAALGLIVGWVTAGAGTKSTELRGWDVLILGPWLLSLAARRQPLAPWERFALALAGGATISHNGRNVARVVSEAE